MSSYAVILAGGSGTRFWPLSRDAAPKQLQPLFEERTLLEAALDRVERVVPRENIVILTAASQRDKVLEVLGGRLAPEQVIAEPCRRDTAPAVALGIAWVAARDGQAVMAVLPSDHLIEDEAAFGRCLEGAFELARREPALLTIGIEPTWACPAYGYIERGAELADPPAGLSAREVVQFREKPDAATAAEYLASGRFAWNAGMFVWSVPTVRAELSLHAPQLAEFVTGASASPAALHQSLGQDFAGLTPTSIDFALLEKAGRVLTLAAPFDWDDVGGWPAVAARLERDGQGNAHRGALTALDARGNVSVSASGRRIALLGVDNLLVVETEDSVLVIPRDRTDEIKKLVGLLPPELR